MAVITINGQMGSGGRELGELIAQAMGYHYVDQEILVEASKRIGTRVEDLTRRDERVSRLRERFGRFLQNFLERSAAAGATGDPFLGPSGMEVLLSKSYREAIETPTSKAQELDDTRFLEVTAGVIKEVAQEGNAVIIGRGSNMILKDFRGTLHVNAIAPFSTRVALMAQRERCDMTTAERLTREMEADRLAFFRKFYKVEALNPAIFHMVLNLGNLPLKVASDMVCSAAKSLEQTPRQS